MDLTLKFTLSWKTTNRQNTMTLWLFLVCTFVYLLQQYIYICIDNILKCSRVRIFIWISFFRCQVPECDASTSNYVIWDPEWLPQAIPLKDDRIEKCRRYIGNETATQFFKSQQDECPSELFKTDQTISCTEFIFKTEEIGVSNEVSIDLNGMCG